MDVNKIIPLSMMLSTKETIIELGVKTIITKETTIAVTNTKT
jgi:hypothetical protein